MKSAVAAVCAVRIFTADVKERCRHRTWESNWWRMVTVHVADYLIAVDGKPILGDTNYWKYLNSERLNQRGEGPARRSREDVGGKVGYLHSELLKEIGQ
jgi:hypothetical protein